VISRLPDETRADEALSAALIEALATQHHTSYTVTTSPQRSGPRSTDA
jgi:hypothetical protein